MKLTDNYLISPRISQYNRVSHLFSTRLGGVSEGEFSSMNLGLTRGDNRDNVIKNYEIICNILRVDINSIVLPAQTHTANVRVVTGTDRGRGIFRAGFSDIDALVTDDPDVTLVCFTADCVPILMFDPEKRVVASVHAGWRGTAAKICASTVDAMRENFGCNPADIIVAIGPSIGQCCYETDRDVADNFADSVKQKYGNKYKIDLKSANAEVLRSCGVNNIDISEDCTYCGHDMFFSHRYTGGKRGSLAAFISLGGGV